MASDALINQAVNAVEELCTPKKMSKEDALDFLEDVVDRLKSSIEALKEEIDG